MNRDPSGKSLYPGANTTDLCPLATFDNEPLYLPGLEPDATDIAQRREQYFVPYHQAILAELERLSAMHPRVVLYDAHSIRSRIPRLFDGELPQFNIGTNGGESCDPDLTEAIEAMCDALGFLPRDQRPLQGRLDHAALRRTRARRARGTDGARLPRLPARAGGAHAQRTGPRHTMTDMPRPCAPRSRQCSKPASYSRSTTEAVE